MEEPKKKPLEEMTIPERREMIVKNIIKMIVRKYPNFPFGIRCVISGTSYEVEIDVKRMFGEYYFMIGVGEEDKARKVFCYLKSGSSEEVLEYMKQKETGEEALGVMYQLLERIEESMETLKSGIPGGEKLQFCISKVRQAFISRFPEVEFGMIFPVPDTKKDAMMWVGKKEEGRYYFQVSVQNTNNDMLVSAFLIFGSREEIMEFLRQEETEKKVFEQIAELSQSVDEEDD